MDTQTRNSTPENDLGAGIEDVLPGMQDVLDADPELASIDTSGELPSENEEVAEVAVPEVDEQQEAEARQYGWMNKEEWVASGKPEKQWRPAEEFNAFRVQAASVFAKENRELRLKVERMERDQQIKAEAEAEARRELQKESLRLSLARAREENDWDAAEKISEQLLDLKLEEKTRPAKAQPAANPAAAASMQNFLNANPVFKTDKTLQRRLHNEVESIIKLEGDNSDVDYILNEALDAVRRMYPEKFQRKPSMADTGGTSGASTNTNNGMGWNDLKPDVRRQYEQMLGGGVTKENLLKRLRQYPNLYFGRR